MKMKKSAKVEKVTIILRGHYDQAKTVTMRAAYNGYDYYVSKRAWAAACRRAGIIEGDYLQLQIDSRDGLLIVEG